MRSGILCTIAICVLSSTLNGQTTRPTVDPWAKMVEQFAAALAQSDASALAPLLADNASVQAFDARTGDAMRLLSRTHGTAMVSAHAYLHAPPAMAADIAQTLAQAQVPGELKRYMTPQNESQMAKANIAAAKWLGEMLGAKPGEPVGVVVFWTAPGSLGIAESVRPEIVFVLVKGGTASGSLRIETIAFGNPQRQTIPSN